MTESAEMDGRVLGKLLLMQCVLVSLPEPAILPFVLQGLSEIAVIGRAEFLAGTPELREPQVGPWRFPLVLSTGDYRELAVHPPDSAAFAPYADYVRNFLFMLALILEERAQCRTIEGNQRHLEEELARRTAQLTEEVEFHRRTEEALRQSRVA
jgi:hypothetical protein